MDRAFMKGLSPASSQIWMGCLVRVITSLKAWKLRQALRKWLWIKFMTAFHWSPNTSTSVMKQISLFLKPLFTLFLTVLLLFVFLISYGRRGRSSSYRLWIRLPFRKMQKQPPHCSPNQTMTTNKSNIGENSWSWMTTGKSLSYNIFLSLPLSLGNIKVWALSRPPRLFKHK